MWLSERYDISLTTRLLRSVKYSSPLHTDWRKSDSSVDGEPQENWRRNSYSKDVVVSSTSFSHPAARAPGRTCSQANGGTAVIHHKSIYKNSGGWGKGALVWNGRVVRYYRVFTSPIIPCFLRRYASLSFLSQQIITIKIITKNAY